jgi:hypothetical protein
MHQAVVHDCPLGLRALARDFLWASNALAFQGAVVCPVGRVRCQERQQGASQMAVCQKEQSAETLEARLVFPQAQQEQGESELLAAQSLLVQQA